MTKQPAAIVTKRGSSNATKGDGRSRRLVASWSPKGYRPRSRCRSGKNVNQGANACTMAGKGRRW